MPVNSDKGSKWEQRFHHFGMMRTRANGAPVRPADLYDIAQPQTRFLSAARASDSAWLPEGPNIITPSKDPASSHGVCRINCIAFHPTNPAIFWVGVAQGGVWKTQDSGRSWVSLTDELPVLRISDIAVDPRHPDTMYISVCDYAYIGISLFSDGRKRHTHYGLGVYKTTDGGQTWLPTGLSFQQNTLDETLIRRIFVHPDSSQVLCAAGFQGIWKSRDGGANWNKISGDLIWDIVANPLNGRTLVSTGGYVGALKKGKAFISRSYDFGETWQVLSTQIPPTGVVQRIAITIARADTNVIYAVSCDMNRGMYAFHSSNDGGNFWQMRTRAQIGKNLLDWGSGSGGSGQGTYDLCILSDPTDVGKVYVGGINLWGTADSGKTWDGISYWLRNYGYTPHADQHQLAYNPLDGKIYVCNDGGLFATSDIKIGSWVQAQSVSGYTWPTRWEDLSGGMQTTSFYRLGLSRHHPGYIVAGAQDNSSFYRTPDGRWFNIFGGDGMEAILHPDRPDELVGSSQFGNFYFTNDTGETYFGISFNISEDGEWTTPLVRHPQNPDYLFAAYNNLWESSTLTDWRRTSQLPGSSEPASALAVCTKYPKNIVLARRPNFQRGINSQLWIRDKKGDWFNHTAGLPDSMYITSVIIDDSLYQRIWVTFGGFNSGIKVFYTGDGGQTWENISRNLPNIPVNCIVQDECSPLNTIYIGTDHGVYFTNDSINYWKTWHYAMPAVIVSELEIQYEERRMYAATFGRGIWSVNMVDTVTCAPWVAVPEPEDTIKVTIVPSSHSDYSAYVYPNPAVNNPMLHYKASTTITYTLIDAMGRRLQSGTLPTGGGERQFVFDNLPHSGIYYLRLDSNGKSKALRFVKQ